MRTHAEKPHEKMPEHLSIAKPVTTKEEMIDAQITDSFPASDPPSYSGGNHIVGAPTNRESVSPSSDHLAVIEAEKKVKQGSAATPHKY
jgi:hypothetical protein